MVELAVVAVPSILTKLEPGVKVPSFWNLPSVMTMLGEPVETMEAPELIISPPCAEAVSQEPPALSKSDNARCRCGFKVFIF
jgi:hypothetical protein